MNKLFTKAAKILVGLSLAAGVGVAVGSKAAERADAGDVVYKSVSFAKTNCTTATGAYTGTAVYSDDIIVNCEYFNTNASKGVPQWDYIKCGQKSSASVASIITDSAIDSAITKVEVTIDAITANNVNSIKLYTSSDGSTWAAETSEFAKSTGVKSATVASPTANKYYKVSFDCKSGSNGVVQVSKIEYYKSDGSTPANTVQSVSITGGPGSTVTSVTVGSAGPTLTATPTMRTGSSSGATFTWTSSNESVAKVSNGALTYTGNGTATISAECSLPAGSTSGDTNIGTISVTTSDLIGASAENTLSVAQALTIVSATGSTATTYDCYTTGVVSRVADETYNSSFGNKTFWISADGTSSNEIEAYRCLYIDGEKMSESEFNSVEAGDTVVIKGKLINYNSNTPEFTQGCNIVSHVKPAVARVSIQESSQTLESGNTLTLHATVENPVENYSITWESGTPSVASIVSSGATTATVTAGNNAGTSTIVAKMLDSNDQVVATSVSITITVIVPVISDGDTFIIYATRSNVDYYLSGITSNLGTCSTTKADALIFTAVEGSTKGQFALQFGDSYLSYSGSNNNVYESASNESDATLWTIENNGTNDVIESVNVEGRKLQYNHNNDTGDNTKNRFACYTSSQTGIFIEKVVVSDPTTLTLDTKTLSLEEEEVSNALTFTTDSPGATFIWCSENPSYATVSNGVVTAGTHAGVSVKIYVYFDTDGSGDFDPAEDLNDYCTVTITAPVIDYSSLTYGGTGTKITQLSDLAVGSKILFSDSADEYFGGPTPTSSGVMATSSATFTVTGSTLTFGDGTTELDAMVLKVATYNSSTGVMTLKHGEKWLVSSAVKKCHLGDSSFEWTLSFDNGQAVLTSSRDASDHMQYNYNSGNPRFAPYASSQTAINIWEISEYTDEAETYADLFLESGLCGANDNTKADSETWLELKDTYENDLSVGAQNVLKSATANENSTDSVQKCLAKYDRVIYLHYNAEPLAYPDFMSRVSGGYVTPISGGAKLALNSAIGENTNTTAIIVIISLVSVTAIGGYFFLKKRREQN